MSQISGPNFGGPLTGNQVGEIFVGMGADLTPLRAKLRQAEQEVKASAAKMEAAASVPIGRGIGLGPGARGGSVTGGQHPGFGMGPGPGVSTIGATATAASAASVSIEHADRRTKSWLRSLTSVRTIMSRLFLPLALIAGVERLVKLFDSLIHSVEDFGEKLRSVNAGPLAEMQAALVRLRVEQGAITELQAELNALRAAERDHEVEMQSALNTKLAILEQLAIPIQVLSNGMVNARYLMIGFAAETQKAVAHARDVLKRHEEILTVLDAQRQARAEQERIERRMREQAKRDITHTVIDNKRMGPALDLLQRQRTAK